MPLLACALLAACTAAPEPEAGERLLIDGGTVVVMDDAGTVLEGGAVLVEGDQIAGLLSATDPRPAGVPVLDATGQLVVPGLVNTHGHAAMSLLRGMADDLPLMTWLEEHIFPAEAALVSPDFVYWGTLLSSIEMLKSGTTTFADMYYFRDDGARATIEAGIRAVVGPHVIGFPAPDFVSPEATLADAAEFMERYRDHPTLVPGVAAHSLYTTSLDDVAAAVQLAIDHDAPFQIHTAEDEGEFAMATELTGMGVIEALESVGALRPGTVLAHSIYLTDEDIERIAAGGAGISHNPQSDMKLGVGRVAPVVEAMAAGIPVSLGTDGPASNNDLDLFDEMDTAAKIHKVATADPTALPAETVFRMATMGGARVLNLHDRIGSLEPGKRADIVLVDIRRAGLTPIYNVYSHLVYAVRGSDVSTVLVNGRVVVRDREVVTVSETEVIERALALRERVVEMRGGGADAGADERLLIDGGTVVVMDETGTVLEGGAVLVDGDQIAGLLSATDPRPAGVPVLDATGQLVIPGLVNTHGHAAMSLLRGMADDLPLMIWLEEHVFPAEAALVSPEFVYWGTLLSSIEMLKSGTTTFADMYYFRDDGARATIEAGIRAVVGPHVIGFPTADFASPEASLADAAEFMERYRDHPTLVPGVAAHSLYTTSLEDVAAAAQLAIDHDAPFQIHTAEDESESATVTELTGMGVIEALESVGALRPGTVLAHSIYLTDEDLERIAAGGAGISHNPQSNMKLGIPRVAPVVEAMAAGIPVSLGTDGPASNNDLDLFGEMDSAAKIHKAMTADPTALPAETVFRMATMGGARVLNLHDRIGSLEPGKRADIVLVDTRRAGLTPIYNVYSHLVYAVRGSDVSTVLVNGRVVVRDREVVTVSEAEVMERARAFRERVMEVMRDGADQADDADGTGQP